MLRASLLLLLLCGCSREQARAATDPRIVVLGPHVREPSGAVAMAWPGSQLKVHFHGTALRARIADAVRADDHPEADRLRIEVDDAPARELVLRAGEHDYELARDLPRGSHRVRLWKQTEAEAGTVRALRFVVDGELEAAPARPILEAVGDSITVGYGNLATSIECQSPTPLTSSHDAYAAVAARELGLDYRAIAYSGVGLTRNYDPNRLASELPDLYDLALPLDPRAGSGAPLSPAAYVVLNVGTNDLCCGVPDEATFARALRRLVSQIRARNPRAQLVLALGPMLFDDPNGVPGRSLVRSWLQRELARLKSAGDTRTAFLELWTNPAEGLGCDYHPSLRTHARMGHELSTLLRGLR